MDLIMTCLSWVLAYYIRFYTFMDAPLGIPETVLYFKLLPFILFIWIFAFSISGFYRRSGKHHSPLTEGLDIIHSSVIAIGLFIVFTYFYEEYRYSRITLAIFGVLNPILIITGRSIIRKIVRRYIRYTPVRNTLIIASGDMLRHALTLSRQPAMERHAVAGVILLKKEETYDADVEFCGANNLAVFAEPESWAEFFVLNPVNSVYIAIPQKAYSYFEANISKIADQVPDIKLIPDIIKFTRFSARIDMVEGVPVIAIHESPLRGLSSVIKRCVDIFGSLCGIMLLSPVLLVISILVPLSSRGPILYRQERMGLDGRSFYCLKFRSMPVDAEKQTGAVWAKATDNRATWLGKFLRRTSLDELPQLFNVLKGEMSLVGPRPERPVFVNKFRSDIPGYMLRHKVKAGITGWAQVNGWRGNTSLEKRIEYDLYYIQNWSIWLDFRILIMTVGEVFFSKNAY
jgi:Undecaprenyl-phosphate glucose phosphotransferase